jgi:hypothetical protein
MRRRIALVLVSLVTVVALACGGWLLDPAGSREQAESQSPARPTTTGPLLYAAVTRQMAARGTATYTWSGTSGGGHHRGRHRVAALPRPPATRGTASTRT